MYYEHQEIQAALQYYREQKAKGKIIDLLPKPKKPSSAYMFYIKEERQNVMDEEQISSPKEAIKVMGERWKSMTSSEKYLYEQMASVAAHEYQEQMKEYEESQKRQMENHQKEAMKYYKAHLKEKEGQDLLKEKEKAEKELKKAKKAEKDPNAPKKFLFFHFFFFSFQSINKLINRPAGAYFLFCADYRQKIKDSKTEGSLNSLLSAKWQSLTEEEKEVIFFLLLKLLFFSKKKTKNYQLALL